MVERDTYPEIEHTVDVCGGYWKKTQDLRFEKGGEVVEHTTVGADPIAPRRGDVDFVFGWPKTGIFSLVEVKYKRRNFSFDEIKPEQRDVLNKYSAHAWLWLGMGERIGGLESPRMAWLIPWRYWLDVEALFILNGLKGMAHMQAKELRHRSLDLQAVDQLAQWELCYEGTHPNEDYQGGKYAWWNIPHYNPMYQLVFGPGM